MFEEVLEERKDGLLLRVKVKPCSQRFEVGDVNPWRNHLEIRVASKPSRGKANLELLDRLVSMLGRDIRIVAGKKSREKKLLVEDISPEEIVQKLDLKEFANKGSEG